MLTHIQLVAWVLKAVLVAMTLSGSGCERAPAASPLASVKWDGPEVLPADSSSKPTDAAQTHCPCGPNCPCKDGYNANCKCPKCPKCERCVCQCECPKSAGEQAGKDAAKVGGTAQTPFKQAQESEPVGDYETHRIRLRLVVSNSCGPCRAIESQTLPPMLAAGWKIAPGKHVEVVYGSGTVPRWERIVDGRVVATQYGFMGPYQVDKFLTGGVEPKRRAK